jgi:ATPase subunit of ABC transporter with duplicated ATPase domains
LKNKSHPVIPIQVFKTFKGNELLKGVTWDCKKGERVGLVGINGAGKTTQLQILMGAVDADSGEVIKSRRNLHIAYLNQEFDIDPERTVREELASAYAEGMAVLQRTEEIQKELEDCADDMDRMSDLLDELDKLSNKAVDLDMATIDKRLDQMMPQLGFTPEDNDRCLPTRFQSALSSVHQRIVVTFVVIASICVEPLNFSTDSVTSRSPSISYVRPQVLN